MPVVSIDVRKKYSPEEETALTLAVHSAIQEAFNILNKDVNVRLYVHEPHRFLVSTNKNNPKYAHPELYTLISIDCFSGRSLTAKRNLYRKIVEKLEPLGIPKDHVKILIREISKENWGIRGGQAGCDVELDYVIEV